MWTDEVEPSASARRRACASPHVALASAWTAAGTGLVSSQVRLPDTIRQRSRTLLRTVSWSGWLYAGVAASGLGTRDGFRLWVCVASGRAGEEQRRVVEGGRIRIPYTCVPFFPFETPIFHLPVFLLAAAVAVRGVTEPCRRTKGLPAALAASWPRITEPVTYACAAGRRSHLRRLHAMIAFKYGGRCVRALVLLCDCRVSAIFKSAGTSNNDTRMLVSCGR